MISKCVDFEKIINKQNNGLVLLRKNQHHLENSKVRRSMWMN